MGNKFHGQGKASKGDYAFYEGQWENGKPHGVGKMSIPEEDNLVYEGEYFHGSITGYGIKRTDS